MFLLKWVSRLALVLVVLLVLIVFVQRAIHGTPTGDWLSFSTDPACELPCWRGITPGVTTVGQAKSILKMIPDTEMVFAGNTVNKSDWTGGFKLRTLKGMVMGDVLNGGLISQDGDNELVMQLHFSAAYKLDTAIEYLGLPSGFAPKGLASMFTIYWKQSVRMISADEIQPLCMNGFENIGIYLILIEGQRSEPYKSKAWTDYADLKNALCNQTH